MDSLEERKKDFCAECMKLGMDFDTACVAAEIGPELKERLASDEDFVARVNYGLALKERELLERLDRIAEENAERGDSRQIERQLELLNPARYSKVTKLSHQIDNSGGQGGEISVSFKSADGGSDAD